MWEHGANMADSTVIAAELSAGGLDAQAILATTQSAEIKATLMANTQSAFERGAFGSPTFFVGRDIYFGKERLRDVEEALMS